MMTQNELLRRRRQMNRRIRTVLAQRRLAATSRDEAGTPPEQPAETDPAPDADG